MRAIGTILAIIVVLALVAFGAGFFLLPKEAVISKTAEIARPANTVYAYLASTPAGAPFGEGTATVTASTPGESVTLDVVGADGATSQAVFTLAPNEGGVSVTMEAKKPLGANPIARLQGLMGGGAAGKALEAQLASLAAEAEALPALDFSSLQYEVVEYASKPFVYVQSPDGPNDPASIRDGLVQAMGLINNLVGLNPGIKIISRPLAVETKWDEAANLYAFQAGVEYEGTAPKANFFVKTGQSPGGTAIRVRYTGAESEIIPVYDQIEALAKATRATLKGPSFEEYLDDPSTPKGSTDRNIYYIVEGDLTALRALAPAPAALPAPQTVPALPAPTDAAAPPATDVPAVAPGADGPAVIAPPAAAPADAEKVPAPAQ